MALATVLATAVDAQHLGRLLPLWSMAPFGVLLLCVAVLPLVAGSFWGENRNKAALCAVLGAPVAIWIAVLEPMVLAHAAREYVAFIILIGALFVISGGIVVRGTLAGTQGMN